jgi:hypothetical protein
MSMKGNVPHYELCPLSELKNYLSLFYCFIILFACNNIKILSLIVFCLN